MVLSSRSNAQDTCICPQVYLPVCSFIVAENDTFYVEFPNECYAVCNGFTVITDTTLCSNPGNGDCGCPMSDSTSFVCAQDTFGNVFSVPNECLAACWGLTVVPGISCDSIPNWDCGCPMSDSTSFVCAQDTFGNVFSVPNECLAACWGLTIVEDGDCNSEPWGNCDCEINESEAFMCAVDSLGHYCLVPNECIAQCWGLTIVNDSLCDPTVVDPEIDDQLLSCIDSLNIDENTNFQQALLMLHQFCGIELSDCILNAPIFTSDAEFLTYILTTCDSLGINGNPDSSNVLNTYNILTNKTSKTSDSKVINQADIRLVSNPVTESLVYMIDSKKSMQASVNLFDINGKSIWTYQHNLYEGKQTFQIDISSMKSGLYLLNLQTAEGQKTLKVVILK